MPDTGAPWSLPFPTIGNAANVPDDIEALAVATDAALDTVNAKTVPGSTVAGAAAFEPQTGWSVPGAALIPMGRLWYYYVSLTRTGAPIAVSASGDIGNQNVAALVPSVLPLAGAVQFPASSVGVGRVAAGYISSGGIVVLASVGGSSAIGTGDSISLAGFFIAAA